ncbi:cellulase family glycosylhydrolase [Skermania piniformis]|uniref:Glycoside hydrolase family 5 protein n=1 Tax=Skermania pinensis TaxID=39122 RepID=A0ABX8SGI5_9ACTN|nr:cellulase family glycosylhydrolase [Skermania piniformis]QXQ14791.1 glycoside hydrolase family 5 protein [Skermania piniformis]
MQIPANTRLWGANLNPAPDYFSAPSSWAQLWQVWDWDNWIRPMIDQVRGIGGSCVRVFGNTHVVTSGQIDLATYLQRWRQLLDYAADNGMKVFPCGGDLGHWGRATSRTAALSLYRAWSELLSGYSNVIGIDITNEASDQAHAAWAEAYSQPEPWFDLIAELGELVRQVSGKPITHSRSAHESAAFRSGFIHTDLLSDFLSVHCYYVPAPSDAGALLAAEWAAGKQLIIGEFGGSRQDGIDLPELFTAVRTVVSSDSRIVGALAWSVRDMGPTPDFGLFDAAGTPRADVAPILRGFPTSR